MFERVLVPLDGSPEAEAALPVAAALTGRAISLVRAVAAPAAASGKPVKPSAAFHEGDLYLEWVAATLAPSGKEVEVTEA